jgi:septal ring factor EnvC (AmiA/AmiB activator)
VKTQLEECKSKIAAEKELRLPLDGERDRMLEELAELKKENQTLKQQNARYERCDPKRLEELAVKKKVCKDGMTRWTDNLYEMESWIKRNNPGMNPEEIYQAFPILRDLDYI